MGAIACPFRKHRGSPALLAGLQVSALKAVLPPAPASSATAMDLDSEDVEEVHLTHVGNPERMQEVLKQRVKYGKASSQAYGSDSDDDMGGRGQRVQCAQQ